MMNRRSAKNSSSQYIGVFYNNSRNIWSASIRIDGCCNKYLGGFKSEKDAAMARDEATKKYFGEFGKLNFPE
jgi:hypothetical protein